MGRKENDRRRVRVKKETLRQLDERTVSPDDLEQVAGGYITIVRKVSNPCGTHN